MPSTCFVNGCSSRADRDKQSFYSFPAIIKHQGEKTLDLSSRRRREWIAAVNRQKEPTKSSKICSAHFNSVIN
jgi:hypothetical protein